MLAPHIRRKVDKLWDRFWAAGLTNPLVAVEQITYLLFLKRLEELDRKRVKSGLTSVYDVKLPIDKKRFNSQTCRWSYIRQQKTNPTHLIEVVFPWLRTIEQRLAGNEQGTELASLDQRMADAYFQLDPNKGQVLADAIVLIDEIFACAGDGNAAQDIMGDTFEYLLSEVATAGKNGQFRTPRHLIRFMVELLDPKPGERLIDPAAGTGGFLFSTQQYQIRQLSTQDNVRLEWDGAPHRIDCALSSKAARAAMHRGANFVGIDNDRTMARIGWMNLVLHGLVEPQLVQGDSLSSRDGKHALAELLKSESYLCVLANPPYAGTVDTADLEKDSTLFPRAGTKGKKKDQALTNKSELLFLWLILDLLKAGGRCAVIVPEGVLFGTTEAHTRLRRELLTEHIVEAIISLPTGAFLPYTAVKTSILLFRKETRRDAKRPFNGQAPRTEHVWFYDVATDGYSLDAKRTARPNDPNDLWDALVQFKRWQREGHAGIAPAGKTYHQPRIYRERWRQARLRDAADQLTPAGYAFADQPDTGMWDGSVWAIHELFPGLPADPQAAEVQVRRAVTPRLNKLASRIFAQRGKSAQHDWNRAVRDVNNFFEDDGPAIKLWRELTKAAQDAVGGSPKGKPTGDVSAEIRVLAREVAKIDGFDVDLRSLAIDQTTEAVSLKHWVVPVRAWAVDETWLSANGRLKGSHDAQGRVRDEYVAEKLARGLYDDDGQLRDGLLTPDCIESRDWSLSVGQYKPFDFAQLISDKSATALIDELRGVERDILHGLDRLQAMMEGRS